MCSSEPRLRATENPSEWRFTWEAQSHVPILRLYLFNANIKPAVHCAHLRVDAVFEQSLLTVSFFETECQIETSLRVPIPRVVVDFESPVHSRTLDDHIEVKLALLLPVDHPLGSNFDSILNSLEIEECNNESLALDGVNELSAASDLQRLSAAGEVNFYCRSCTTKLTRGIRVFKEMPSVDWRDVADNWFGTCCCSFGGVSEKLVMNYAKSYYCTAGLCLLSKTSVIISTDDLLECELPERNKLKKYDSDLKSDDISYLNNSMLGNENDQQKNVCCENICKEVQGTNKSHFVNCCTLDPCENLLGQHESVVDLELPVNQKIFLNGFLGDAFMARPSYLSKDIEWIEFFCPKCSCLLGAYPSHNDRVPLDGGVRLYKFYISTSLPANGAYDLFRNYSFERMFTSQLLESAKDELSFRTVVRDLHNKCHSLQIVLLNPNAWSYAGFCLHALEPAPKINVYPVIKVLFSANNNDVQLETRSIEEWVTKKQAQEVYLLPSQIKELIANLKTAHITYPQSHNFSQGFSVSSLKT
ncbi:uncharacterized protein LOC116011922 [Ipomoea triloba]|uniref:uncharacterized protein LOC116011922 n=1 Tax=Ipomoea triloba TaxID=35885 RepID=UPI00125D7DC2|nr:uncharacterized protein LOC116011922 [Ipomoea triloba]XP_031107215.1 uncharacterized protein LOC116011922 [Ipomoea triloba]